MKAVLQLVEKIYEYLLHLYPHHFREEFSNQMLADFSEMAEDASRRGIYSLSLFCLREIVDFPINLLRVHLRERLMLKILPSQSISIGLRSSLGFGVAFGIANIISMLTVLKLAISENSIVSRLQAIYSDVYPLELISWIPSALGSLLTGLVLGVMLAVLFADRSKYPRYILVGMFGWFLHNTARGFLSWCFNLSVFLDGNQIIFFTNMTLILSGSFLGLIFVVAKSERKEFLLLLIVGSFAYPLIAYLYVKQLLSLFIFNTPWRFVSLTILMLFLMVGVVFIALKSDANRKIPWVVIAGAVGQPVLTQLVFFIGQFIFPPIPSWGILHDEFIFLPLELSISASNAIYGILFGSLVGLVLGFQKRNSPPEIIV